MALRERRASFFCVWKHCCLFRMLSEKIKTRFCLSWPQAYLSCLKIRHIRNYKVINGTIKIMFFVLAYLQVVTPLIASLIQGKINWAGLRVLCWVVMIYWNSCVRRILRSQSFSQWPKSLFMLFIFSFNKTKSICCTGAKPWLTVNSWFRSTWLL